MNAIHLKYIDVGIHVPFEKRKLSWKLKTRLPYIYIYINSLTVNFFCLIVFIIGRLKEFFFYAKSQAFGIPLSFLSLPPPPHQWNLEI